MDEALSRSLLLMEIGAFLAELAGRGIPAQFNTAQLEKAPMTDLQSIHRSLRDTLRSLGGSKSN